MKMIELKKELSTLNAADLTQKVEEFRKELFSLRLNASTAHVKDYSQFKKLRGAIACALTYLHQKQVQAQ